LQRNCRGDPLSQISISPLLWQTRAKLIKRIPQLSKAFAAQPLLKMTSSIAGIVPLPKSLALKILPYSLDTLKANEVDGDRTLWSL
jgi:hypothetical protein